MTYDYDLKSASIKLNCSSMEEMSPHRGEETELQLNIASSLLATSLLSYRTRENAAMAAS